MDSHPTDQASARRRSANRAHGQTREHTRVRARARRPRTRYKVTRRTLERRLFMVPDAQHAEELNNLIGYCLGYALEKYEVDLHAACFESNHSHMDVFDRLGQLPGFKQMFFSFLARGINALRGRFETVWAPGGSCDTEPAPHLRLEGDEFDPSPLGDLVYTLTNPVKDGLVKKASRWPGFTTEGWRFGETRTFRKPTHFFDAKNSKLPDTVSITLVRPDVLPQLSDDEVYDQLTAEVHAREKFHQKRLTADSRRFMGEDKIQGQRWNKVPESRSARFRVKPKIAEPSRWARLAALQRDRDWERAYASARADWSNGNWDVEFPFGTYWMQRFVGVRVAAAPP